MTAQPPSSEPSDIRPQAAAAAAATGRRPRMALADVKAAVLAKARELLITEQGGLTVSMDHVNLEIIIAAAGVSRSSAHRQWPAKEDFIVDFLCDIAGPHWAGTAAFDPETIKMAVDTAHQKWTLLQEPDGRRRHLAEVVRVAAEQNFRAITASAEWRTYVTLTATLVSMRDPIAKSRVHETLKTAETGFVNRMSDFYAAMGEMLGFQPKPPFSYRHLAAAGAALVEGLALRQIIGIDLVTAPLTIEDSQGNATSWSLAAAGFMAVLESMIEMPVDVAPKTQAEFAALASMSTAELAALFSH